MADPHILILGGTTEARALASRLVARGGLQYRDNPEEMTAKTDADGKVSITWPEAGMYWVNTSWRDPAAPAGPGGRHGPPVASAQYTAVRQVLP